jgi:hypothetical protein
MSRPEAEDYQNKVRFVGHRKPVPETGALPGKMQSKSKRNWMIAPLLNSCFGPLSGADKTFRFAPDAGQITVAKLAERFFGQLTITAQGR